MTPDVIAAVFAGVALIAGSMAKLGYEFAKRRDKSPSDPPRNGRRTLSGGMAAVVDSQAMRRDVERIHEIVTVTDEDGAPKVHNKPSVERSIRQTEKHTLDQVKESKRTNELLEQLIACQPRERMPPSPGE